MVEGRKKIYFYKDHSELMTLSESQVCKEWGEIFPERWAGMRKALHNFFTRSFDLCGAHEMEGLQFADYQTEVKSRQTDYDFFLML